MIASVSSLLGVFGAVVSGESVCELDVSRDFSKGEISINSMGTAVWLCSGNQGLRSLDDRIYQKIGKCKETEVMAAVIHKLSESVFRLSS